MGDTQTGNGFEPNSLTTLLETNDPVYVHGPHAVGKTNVGLLLGEGWENIVGGDVATNITSTLYDTVDTYTEAIRWCEDTTAPSMLIIDEYASVSATNPVGQVRELIDEFDKVVLIGHAPREDLLKEEIHRRIRERVTPVEVPVCGKVNVYGRLIDTPSTTVEYDPLEFSRWDW